MIKFYFDLMSQPSRALYIFLKLTKIPFEACPVALKNGQHFSEEFKEQYSKFQKVPFIHDGDFRLAESVGIFRYLTREYQVEDYWYPKDSKLQAKVDEYMEWQHNNIRLNCAMYFQTKWLQPLITGKTPLPEKVQTFKTRMEESLEKFEEFFLSNGDFIIGDKISFADILAACEIEQTRMTGFEPGEGRPKLQRWIEKVRTKCNPDYDEAHKIVNKITEDAKKGIQAKL